MHRRNFPYINFPKYNDISDRSNISSSSNDFILLGKEFQTDKLCNTGKDESFMIDNKKWNLNINVLLDNKRNSNGPLCLNPESFVHNCIDSNDKILIEKTLNTKELFLSINDNSINDFDYKSIKEFVLNSSRSTDNKSSFESQLMWIDDQSSLEQEKAEIINNKNMFSEYLSLKALLDKHDYILKDNYNPFINKKRKHNIRKVENHKKTENRSKNSKNTKDDNNTSNALEFNLREDKNTDLNNIIDANTLRNENINDTQDNNDSSLKNNISLPDKERAKNYRIKKKEYLIKLLTENSILNLIINNTSTSKMCLK